MLKFRLSISLLFIFWFGPVTGVVSAFGQYAPEFISDDYIYRNWTTKDELPVNTLSGVVQGRDHYIWISSSDGLIRFDGLSFETFSTSNTALLGTNRIRDVREANGGLVVLTEFWNVFYIKEGIFTKLKFSESDQLQGAAPGILNDKLYIYNAKEVYLLDGDQLKFISDPELHTRLLKLPTAIFKTEEGWNSSAGSVYKDGEEIFRVNDRITGLALDHEGSVWVSTESLGLFQIKRNLFKVFSLSEGLPSRNVYPVYEDSEGRVWVGTHGGGPAYISGDRVHGGFLFTGLENHRLLVRSFLELDNGSLLVSVLGQGLYRYTGDRIFEKFPSPREGMTVNALFQDKEGRIWAGSSSGVFRYENNSWVQFGGEDLAAVQIRDIVQTPDGAIWFATAHRGLIRVSEGSFTFITKQQSLSSNNIRCLLVERGQGQNYTLWVGAEDAGLNKLSFKSGDIYPGSILNLTVKEGLYDNSIHSIVKDLYDRIWMNTNRGLSWIDSEEVLRFENQEVRKITAVGYTEEEGLINREGNGGVKSTAIVDEKGFLWFSTQDGVIKADPIQIHRNMQLPRIVIKQLRSGGQVIDHPDEVYLTEDSRDLEIDFSSLSYISPEKNQYRYRLFGFDDEWVEAGTRRTAYYTNLPAGRYRFKVTGSNNDKVWNDQGDVIEMRIAGYFYESTSFYIALILIVSLSVAWLVRFLLREQKRKRTELEDKLERRDLETERAVRQLHELRSLQKLTMETLKKKVRKPLSELPIVSESDDQEPGEKHKKVIQDLDHLVFLQKLNIEDLSPNYQDTDLVGVIRNVLQYRRPESDSLIFETNAEQLELSLDEEFVRIILNALLDYLSERAGDYEIRINLVEEHDIVTIKITVQGLILGQESMEEMMGLFKEEPKEETAIHSDLSVSMASRLVQLQGGSLVVHSLPEERTIFTVSFTKRDSAYALDAGDAQPEEDPDGFHFLV